MFKVLISDDEPWILKALQQRINWDEIGLELVATANNGIDCLKHARNLSPDLLITDVRMPGLTGLELAETLRKEAPDLKVILISGFADFEYARKGIELGILGYLLKPIVQEELDNLLRDAVTELKKKSSEIDSSWRHFRTLIDRGTKSGHLTELLLSLNITGNSEAVVCVLTRKFSLDLTHNFPGSRFKRNMGAECELLILSGTRWECDQFALFMQTTQIPIGSIIAVSSTVIGLSRLGEAISEAEAAYCRAYYGDTRKTFFFEETGNQRSPLVNDILDSLDKGKSNLALSTVKALEAQCSENDWPIEDLVLLVNSLIVRSQHRLRTQPTSGVVPHPIGNSIEMTLRYPTFRHLFAEVHQLINNDLNKTKESGTDSILVYRVRDYIETHFSDDIHLGLLSEQFELDKNTIGQKFRSTYDLSVSEFLKDTRLRHAEYLLKNTELPVTTISELCGYPDYYYFAKLFKKNTGFTCSQFRNQLQNS